MVTQELVSVLTESKYYCSIRGIGSPTLAVLSVLFNAETDTAEANEAFINAVISHSMAIGQTWRNLTPETQMYIAEEVSSRITDQTHLLKMYKRANPPSPQNVKIAINRGLNALTRLSSMSNDSKDIYRERVLRKEEKLRLGIPEPETDPEEPKIDIDKLRINFRHLMIGPEE